MLVRTMICQTLDSWHVDAMVTEQRYTDSVELVALLN